MIGHAHWYAFRGNTATESGVTCRGRGRTEDAAAAATAAAIASTRRYAETDSGEETYAAKSEVVMIPMGVSPSTTGT